MVHILSAVIGENLGSLAYIGMIAVPSSSSMMACLLVLGVCLGLDSHLAVILSHWRRDTDILNRHLSLLCFRFDCLHIHSTFSSVSSWSLPYSAKPSIKMLSAIPRHLACHWIIHLYLLEHIFSPGQLQRWSFILIPAKNSVRYEDLSSNFKLW